MWTENLLNTCKWVVHFYFLFFSIIGIFKSKDEIISLRKIGKVFIPRAHVKKSYEYTFSRWEDAVKRLCGWYTETKTQNVCDNVINNKMAEQNGGYSK